MVKIMLAISLSTANAGALTAAAVSSKSTATRITPMQREDSELAREVNKVPASKCSRECHAHSHTAVDSDSGTRNEFSVYIHAT